MSLFTGTGGGAARAEPAAPPPAGQEAGYAWYAKQYPNPNMFTLIGPPADPGDTAVSADGQLFSAASPDNGLQGMYPRLLPGVSARYIKHAVAFALFDKGRVVPLGKGGPLRQSVARGFLPIVVTEWTYGCLSVKQTACAEPLRVDEFTTDNQRTRAWAGFEITNTCGHYEDFTLLAFYTGDEKTLRPELTFRDGAVFQGDDALFSVQASDGLRTGFSAVFPGDARPASGDESVRFLDSRQGVFNALAISGRIEPGKSARFAVNRVINPGQNMNWSVTPEAPPVAAAELAGRSFETGLERATHAWSRLADGRLPFETPEAALNDIARKALLDGLILTKRWAGRHVVYDSVIYRCQWDNPSTNWIYALDITGDHQASRRLLDTIFERQGLRKPGGMRTREGCFTDVTNINRDGSLASWASCNGWALWAMAEHARLTGDRAWLDRHKQQIVNGCEWIVRERGFSREKPDNPCRGLLYGKFVCDLPGEGEVGEAGYFTYTDAISYAGLHAAARLLADWGHTEGITLLKESESYRADILAAVNRLTDKSQDPWYVPWVLSAPKYQQRYFHDIVGPVNLAYSCGTGGVVPADHELISQTIRWMVERAHQGSLEHYAAGHEPPVLNRGAAFYSQDLALALLERGQVEDFLRVFYAVLAAGVSHDTYTTTEWGDNTQPHIHSISAILRMLRTMLVQERGGALYLLQGAPRTWLAQGQMIILREAPTWYGPLSLTCRSDVEHGTLNVDLKLPPGLKDTPVRLRLRLPNGGRLDSATVDGRPARVDGEWVVLQGIAGPAKVTVSISR